MVVSGKPFPKKSLSQNYLIDENICRKIVNSFKINRNDLVIEIGAGRGAITKYIAQATVNFAAIELDKENCKHLQKTIPGLKLINADFLKTDFKNLEEIFELNNARLIKPKFRIIGNIPYNITTQILFKLFDNHEYIIDVMLMLQEEVAKRLTAVPNNKIYGITSVFTKVYTSPKLLFSVSRNCFFPQPQVDSRIVYFEFSKNHLTEINNIEFFKKVVKQAFSTRRKTLRNSLEKIKLNLEKTDFDFSRRAETLSTEEFIFLSNKLYKQTQES